MIEVLKVLIPLTFIMFSVSASLLSLSIVIKKLEKHRYTFAGVTLVSVFSLLLEFIVLMQQRI